MPLLCSQESARSSKALTGAGTNPDAKLLSARDMPKGDRIFRHNFMKGRVVVLE